jgi:hypothetical protein
MAKLDPLVLPIDLDETCPLCGTERLYLRAGNIEKPQNRCTASSVQRCGEQHFAGLHRQNVDARAEHVEEPFGQREDGRMFRTISGLQIFHDYRKLEQCQRIACRFAQNSLSDARPQRWEGPDEESGRGGVV